MPTHDELLLGHRLAGLRRRGGGSAGLRQDLAELAMSQAREAAPQDESTQAIIGTLLTAGLRRQEAADERRARQSAAREERGWQVEDRDFGAEDRRGTARIEWERALEAQATRRTHELEDFDRTRAATVADRDTDRVRELDDYQRMRGDRLTDTADERKHAEETARKEFLRESLAEAEQAAIELEATGQEVPEPLRRRIADLRAALDPQSVLQGSTRPQLRPEGRPAPRSAPSPPAQTATRKPMTATAARYAGR